MLLFKFDMINDLLSTNLSNPIELFRGAELCMVLIVKSVNVHNFMFRVNKSHCAITISKRGREKCKRGEELKPKKTMKHC